MKPKIGPAPLKVGIVANEFFNQKVGRVGGFGWAAEKASTVLRNHPESNSDVYFITAENIRDDSVLNGTPLITLNGNRLSNFLKLIPLGIDVLLTIDYRSSYRGVFNALPFTPIITWVRDPRTTPDIEKIKSLKIPGNKSVVPAGISDNDMSGLSKYANRNFPFSNKVCLANKMTHLRKTNSEVYNLPESEFVLPNPSVVNYDAAKIDKDDKPTVIFIGRLDPIKRPWLFIELAKNFPAVDFLMLGQQHFNGKCSWKPANMPANLKLLGHVTGKEKHRILSSAWVFVNTSIHEESPVSVMEALAYETPVVSYEDWGGIVVNHGIAIGQHPGTGMEGIPQLSNALRILLNNHNLRRNYGKAGRDYVEKEHNDQVFLSSFRDICLNLNIKKVTKHITV